MIATSIERLMAACKELADKTGQTELAPMIQTILAENTMLKEQVAQLNLFIYGDNGYQQNIAEKTETITQQAEAIRVATEQIRKCDYTPARSTLLCVMKDFK